MSNDIFVSIANSPLSLIPIQIPLPYYLGLRVVLQQIAVDVLCL